jgi:hypothetical protein
MDGMEDEASDKVRGTEVEFTEETVDTPDWRVMRVGSGGVESSATKHSEVGRLQWVSVYKTSFRSSLSWALLKREMKGDVTVAETDGSSTTSTDSFNPSSVAGKTSCSLLLP